MTGSPISEAERQQLLARPSIEVTDAAQVAALNAAGFPAHRLTTAARPAAAPDDQAHLAWRGVYGDQHSLAILASNLTGAYEHRYGRVMLRVQHADAVPGDIPGVHLSWPPRFTPVTTDGPVAVYLPWEYGNIPVTWAQALERDIDRIWTLSEHTKHGFVTSGVPADLVDVVPCGVDLDRFAPDGARMTVARRSDDTIVFCFVGGSIFRKGPDLLMAAWDRAFNADDDVLLVFKDFGSGTVYQGQNAQQPLAEWAARTDHAPVQLICEHLPSAQLPGLYRAADVAVFPYRGEGFCLPALEAMACGVPVIHPAEGPTNEFCRAAGWTVPGVPIRQDSPADLPLTDGHARLYEIDVERLADTLRAAAADHRQQAAAARGEAEAFSWQHAAARMHDAVARLADGGRPVRTWPNVDLGDTRDIVLAVRDLAPGDPRNPVFASALRVLGEHDPVTIAVFCSDGDPDRQISQLLATVRAVGRDPDGSLPDITVITADRDPEGEWLAMCAAADGVLIADADVPPARVHRAVTTDTFAEWAAAHLPT